jgi:hypothetical protein
MDFKNICKSFMHTRFFEPLNCRMQQEKGMHVGVSKLPGFNFAGEFFIPEFLVPVLPGFFLPLT